MGIMNLSLEQDKYRHVLLKETLLLHTLSKSKTRELDVELESHQVICISIIIKISF